MGRQMSTFQASALVLVTAAFQRANQSRAALALRFSTRFRSHVHGGR